MRFRVQKFRRAQNWEWSPAISEVAIVEGDDHRMAAETNLGPTLIVGNGLSEGDVWGVGGKMPPGFEKDSYVFPVEGCDYVIAVACSGRSSPTLMCQDRQEKEMINYRNYRIQDFRRTNPAAMAPGVPPIGIHNPSGEWVCRAIDVDHARQIIDDILDKGYPEKV